MKTMEQQIRNIIEEVFSDLTECFHQAGETMCAENLVDTVGDRMLDVSAKYRAMEYNSRRDMVLRICSEYV